LGWIVITVITVSIVAWVAMRTVGESGWDLATFLTENGSMTASILGFPCAMYASRYAM